MPQLERSSYAVLSLLTIGIVFLSIYLIGTGHISLNPKIIALTGLIAQLVFVQRREADIGRGHYWRILYACIVWLVCASFIGLVHFSPSLYENPIRHESQAILGGFLLFNLLIVPVHISCVLRKGVTV